jgi:hypothetical protein
MKGPPGRAEGVVVSAGNYFCAGGAESAEISRRATAGGQTASSEVTLASLT